MERPTFSSLRVSFLVLSMSSPLLTVDSLTTDFVHFEVQPGKKHKDEHVYQAEESSSVFRCATQCVVKEDCESLSFGWNDGLCLLSRSKAGEGQSPEMLIAAGAEWLFLSPRGGSSYWIGLNDKEVDGRFVWTSNGAVAEYSVWSRGEPKQGKKASCVAIWRGSRYKWSDARCALKKYAICEI